MIRVSYASMLPCDERIGILRGFRWKILLALLAFCEFDSLKWALNTQTTSVTNNGTRESFCEEKCGVCRLEVTKRRCVLPSPSELSETVMGRYLGKVEDWFCMKLLEEV